MKKDWIQTRSGKKFFPLNPSPADICIEDIAWALSNVCRYTGHCSRFYSVAEHCVWVSREAERRAADYSNWKKYIARWGLLHDASEAYIADVSRPLKQLPAFDEYRKAERYLQNILVQRFGLDAGEPDLVKQVDTEMLGTEVAQLMQPLHPEWKLTTSTGGLSEPIPWIMRRKLGKTPRRAHEMFMARYKELWP